MIYDIYSVVICGRLVWNENGASSNSQFLQLTSDMSSGFDTASKPDFERIPQSLRFGMDGEPKSSTGVLMSHPTSWFGSDCSSLPGYKASLTNSLILFETN